MARRIDIELDARRVCIIFPYDASLLPVVRSLPERSFDGQTKNWYVPLEHHEHVIRKLADHHFKLSADLRQYCVNEGRPVSAIIEAAADGAGLGQIPDDTYSISQLNEQARAVVRAKFPDDLWLVGELQGYERNRPGGHAYFELVERLAADEDPVARIGAVMFREDRQAVAAALADGPDDIRLRDGLAVRLSGRIDLYAPQGSYQFIVRDIDPGYTTGEIHQNRQRILDGLDEQGIRQQNQTRPWPGCPLRVGLITSYESDAYNDFVDELASSEFGFELTVHHANVQGSRAEGSILDGLGYFARRAAAFDVLAVVRGGGSRSDLAYFDTQAIGQAVCEHPLKIVAGVGHQRDQCLLDFVSESQKTPTAAANACVGRVSEYMDRVEDTFGAIAEHAAAGVDAQMRRLRRASVGLERGVDRRLKAQSSRIERVCSTLMYAAKDRVNEAARRLEGLKRSIPAAALARVDAQRQQVSFARRRLAPERLLRRLGRQHEQINLDAARLRRVVDNAIEAHSRRVSTHREHLRLLDPQRVLERGFAMVIGPDGVVRRPDDIGPDQDIDVRLAEGRVVVRRVDDPD